MFISICRTIIFSDYNLVWQLCINKQGGPDLRFLQQEKEARTQSELYCPESMDGRILRCGEDSFCAICLLRALALLRGKGNFLISSRLEIVLPLEASNLLALYPSVLVSQAYTDVER